MLDCCNGVSCNLLLLMLYCSGATFTTDARGQPMVKLTVHIDLKQNQGGLKQSKGNLYMQVTSHGNAPVMSCHQLLHSAIGIHISCCWQGCTSLVAIQHIEHLTVASVLQKHPSIPLYPNTEVPQLCFYTWLQKDDIYRQRVERRAKASTGAAFKACDRLFLQPAWHKGGTKAAAAAAKSLTGIAYKDELQNSPAGVGRFEEILKLLCEKAGVNVRTNHALRHEFIESCYDAGMFEVETSTFTRHTSVEGLRSYARYVLLTVC